MGQIVRIIKVGTGLYARIPTALARQLDLRRRDYLHVDRAADTSLRYRRVALSDLAPEPRR